MIKFYIYLWKYMFIMQVCSLTLHASLPNKFEQEPNDLAVNATVFRGSKTLVGKLQKNEIDHFLWKVSKKDSQFSWDIELNALSQQNIEIEVSKVVFQKAGLGTVSFSKNAKELKSKEVLFIFKNESNSKKKIFSDLLVEKDAYLIRVYSKNNIQTLPYSINVKKSKKIYIAAGLSKKKSANLYGGYCYYSNEKQGWFKIDIKEKGKLWDIESSISLGVDVGIQLEDEEGVSLGTIEPNMYGKASFRALELDEENYYLKYAHAKGGKYCIDFLSTGTQSIDKNEFEKNNDFSNANTIRVNKTIHGAVEYKKDRKDYFTFILPSTYTHKSVNIQLYTPSKTLAFSLYDKNQNHLQTKSLDSNYTMPNLALEAGKRYYLSVSSDYRSIDTQSYTFDFSKPIDINTSIEIEPNDELEQSSFTDITQTIHGEFKGKEQDCFHFPIKESNQFWTFKVMGNGLKTLYLYQNNKEVIRSSEIEEDTLVLSNLFLSIGEYSLCTYGTNGKYSITMSHQSKEDMNLSKNADFELEPNQSSTQANLLRFGVQMQGVLERKDNEDYFYFELKNDTHIKLTATPAQASDINIRLITPQETKRSYPQKGENAMIEGIYPAGRYVLNLFTKKPSYGYYSLMLEKMNPFVIKENDFNSTQDISISLHGTEKEIATYIEEGQRFDFSIKVKSEINSTQKITVKSHSSDATWKISLDETDFTLLRGETKEIKANIIIPSNVPQEEVVFTLKVAKDTGSFETISFSVTPKEDILALNAYKYWTLPTPLLGTLNVARTDLGAKRILEHNETSLGHVPKIGKYYHYLFDDKVYGRNGFYLNSYRKVIDENVTIALLGNKPVLVKGVSLNLKGYDSINYMLRKFSISLSLDGKVFNRVYTGSLKVNNTDQFFTFNTPYQARFARLTLHDNQIKDSLGRITLGEWKVLASPKSVALDTPFNIASPLLGGHVVKSSHLISGVWDQTILSDKEDSSYIRTKKEDNVFSFVLSFKHQRVAKINAIVWKESIKSSVKNRFDNVHIEVSTQTPNGPWKSVGVWDKNKSIEQNTSTYSFDKPTWARYVKLSSVVKERTKYYPPETLEVFEEKPSSTYKSILGEWGGDTHHSFYITQVHKNKEILPVLVSNATKDTAYTLEHNKSVKGSVSVAKHQEDWYQIIIPEGENTLSVTLSNDESVDVSHLLYDAKNAPVIPTASTLNPNKHTLDFSVSAGTYLLKIYQPPINVVFAWDNSGSVSPYQEQIKTAVTRYVSNIEKDIDNVNLLCFGNPNTFVLSDFSDKAQDVQTAFNNYDWNCNSSNAESALKASTIALKTQKGIKGVILIADADGSRGTELWNSLNETRPKVFSIRVASNYNSQIFANLMQNWSRVNNGTYATVENSTEMTKAINHAMYVLKRPVFYTLKYESSFIRPLGKGSLKVINPKPSKENKKTKKTDKNFAVELILDASGSMLKRIKGKRRIEIAKDVLVKAVQEIIPPQTLIALRVFGHKKSGSCRTDLEMRLQPLNVTKTSKIIKKIKAKNLAKTPIAASLAKVASDLKTVKGKRVIILVTDGKETCEGNATQEIEKLKALGIDVRLNIVGFAIDDDALKKEFQTWAKLGNGSYFEANDKKSLDEAVKKALQVPYKVFTLDGEIVYKGMVGDDGLKLQGGTYKVIIESYPQRVYTEVVVKGEEESIINITKQQKRKK